MNEEQVRQIIREEIGRFYTKDKFIFFKHTQILDGRNIQIGITTGTKIGTASTQKIGFYGTAPTAQQTGVAVSAIGIHEALVNLGLITA